jgi:hypothetical protein
MIVAKLGVGGIPHQMIFACGADPSVAKAEGRSPTSALQLNDGHILRGVALESGDGETSPARIDMDENAAEVRLLNATHDVRGSQGEPSISDQERGSEVALKPELGVRICAIPYRQR